MGFTHLVKTIRSNRTSTRLLLLGLLSEAVYAGYFLNSFFLPRYYNIPFLDLGKLTDHTWSGLWLFAGVFTTLFLGYYAAYRLCLVKQNRIDDGHDAMSFWLIIGFAALFSLTLIFIYPVGAADVFDYIFHGRILVHYGQNPFQSLIADYPNDQFYPYPAWKSMPSVYGPIWLILSAFPSLLGGDDLLLNLILYKAVVVLTFMVASWLIYRILLRLAPHYALAGTLLMAWNPLALYETAGNGHNDVVMAPLALLGIYFFVASNRTRAILGITAAGLMKFSVGLLAPLFLVSYLKQLPRWTERIGFAAKTAISCILLTVALYAPFWIGPQMLGLERRQGLFTDSLPTIAMLSLEPLMGLQQARMVASGVAAALFLALLVWRVVRVDVRPIEVLASSFDLLYLYLLFLAQWFQPWYLLWIIPLAAVVPRLDIANKAMLFSYTAVWAYFVFTALYTWYTTQLGLLGIEIFAAAAVHALPIAYTVYNALAKSPRREDSGRDLRLA